MNALKLQLALIFLLTMTAGCATLHYDDPTPQEANAAEYGPKPSEPEKGINSYFHDTLKDPDSAKIEMGNLRREYWGYHGAWFRWSNGFIHHGWAMPVRVNAKNSYGAYEGFKSYLFLFENGFLIDHIGPDKQVGYYFFYGSPDTGVEKSWRTYSKAEVDFIVGKK